MLFSQKERFEPAKADSCSVKMYIPKSTLSSIGTKIVDSWSSIDAPRLDHELILKDGVFLKAKKDWLHTATDILLTDLDKVKKKTIAYTFPKRPRSMGLGSTCAAPDAVYNLSPTLNNRGISLSPRQTYSTKTGMITANATVLSIEMCKVAERATRPESPRISFGG